jgi:hypothetical protein
LGTVDAALFGAITSKPVKAAEEELIPSLKGKGLVYRSPIVLMRQMYDLYICQSIQGEGEGIVAYGKGVEGFYIDAGKTLVIRFIAQRQGRYEFRCDLHPQMTGEVFLLEMSTA